MFSTLLSEKRFIKLGSGFFLASIFFTYLLFVPTALRIYDYSSVQYICIGLFSLLLFSFLNSIVIGLASFSSYKQSFKSKSKLDIFITTVLVVLVGVFIVIFPFSGLLTKYFTQDQALSGGLLRAGEINRPFVILILLSFFNTTLALLSVSFLKNEGKIQHHLPIQRTIFGLLFLVIGILIHQASTYSKKFKSHVTAECTHINNLLEKFPGSISPHLVKKWEIPCREFPPLAKSCNQVVSEILKDQSPLSQEFIRKSITNCGSHMKNISWLTSSNLINNTSRNDNIKTLLEEAERLKIIYDR